MKKKEFCCTADIIKQYISSKWTMCILCRLFEGKRRYATLESELNPISHKVLTQRLKRLERDGIVLRTVIPSTPIQVEYSLTPHGKEVKELAKAIRSWVTDTTEVSFTCEYSKQYVV